MQNISVACIAFRKNKVFIALRNPTGEMGGKWEFPGGKVEHNESEESAIIREFQEEFSVKVKVGEKITEGTFTHKDKEFVLKAYRIFLPRSGRFFRFKLTEHSDYKWIDVNQVTSLDFVDSDLKIYPDIKKYIIKNEK